MTDQPDPSENPPPEGDPWSRGGRRDDGPANEPAANDKPPAQRFTHKPVSARVPERVARGAYSTGQVILDSPREFVIDFLQGLTRPQQVVCRVVLAPGTMQDFAAALRQNLDHYTRTFGTPPPLPPPGPNRPSVQEVYENFKLPDELMSGAYANAVLIGHSVTEFFFDFITTFYPTSAVSARVYVPAAIVPRFLTSLDTAVRQYQARYPQKGNAGGTGVTGDTGAGEAGNAGNTGNTGNSGKPDGEGPVGGGAS